MIDQDRKTGDRLDVIVIGGGPAGSTCATLLAQKGLKVRLYEREKFPRFHIGESLLPNGYPVFERLGMLDKLKKSAFVKKYSVQFINQHGKESQPFYFYETNPHESSQTWQVVRSEFDKLMLDNAAEKGAEVQSGVRVLEVILDGEQAKGVRIQYEDGTREEVFANIVVDASGQSSVLASKFKTKISDEYLKNASVWTYIEGARREPAAHDEGATLVVSLPEKKGWWWYIPQHNNIVSVGVVSTMQHLLREGGTPEEIFNRQLERTPGIKKRIEVGRRVTGYYTTKDFSYRSSRVAGDHWVLCGDAYGFLDPLYSSGVLLALHSATMAADAIIAGYEKNDFSEAQLGAWGPNFDKGMDRMKRLVYAFYEGLSFGQFVRRYPHCKKHIIDLLSGDVFKDVLDEVYEPLDSMRELQEAEAADSA